MEDNAKVESQETIDVAVVDDTEVDENMNLFVYGNLLIKDVDTGEILVNKRF